MTPQELVEKWWNIHSRDQSLPDLLGIIERDLIDTELSEDAGSTALRFFVEIRLATEERRRFLQLLQEQSQRPPASFESPPEILAMNERHATLQQRLLRQEQQRANSVTTAESVRRLELRRDELVNAVEKLNRDPQV